jgi:beta-galactosidase
VQKVLSPIQFEAFDAVAGTVTVRNRHDFIDLSGFAFDWVLQENGVAIAQGRLPPLATKARSPDGGPETTRLRAQAGRGVLRHRSAPRPGRGVPLTPAGYVVGWEQFSLGGAAARPTRAAGKVALSESAETVSLEANGVSLKLDRATGLVSGYAKVGGVFLTGGAPSFLRAETDNDTLAGTVRQQRRGRR